LNFYKDKYINFKQIYDSNLRTYLEYNSELSSIDSDLIRIGDLLDEDNPDTNQLISQMSPKEFINNVLVRSFKKLITDYQNIIENVNKQILVGLPKFQSETKTNINDNIRRWNAYILESITKSEYIDIDLLPMYLKEKLPPGYLNQVDAYNYYRELQNKNESIVNFKYDYNQLLIKEIIEIKKPEKKEIPKGFSEIANNAFFKKIEGQIKNNYSDMMGEYSIPGTSQPCKLYMDQNYKYVVVQGENRRVFDDPIEARRFCLLGGFEADKVQEIRASQLITNKLKKPFRVIAKTSV